MSNMGNVYPIYAIENGLGRERQTGLSTEPTGPRVIPNIVKFL